MAIYWMTEAMPIAATALVPFAFMPWLGVVTAKEIAKNYMKVSKSTRIFNKTYKD